MGRFRNLLEHVIEITSISAFNRALEALSRGCGVMSQTVIYVSFRNQFTY